MNVTTTEAQDRRHLVEPYKERPVVELRQGTVACPFCGNPQFRRSRLRFTDIFEVLMLRYPVRCTRCSQRQFAEIYIAMLAFPPKHKRFHQAHDNESWKSWTDPAAPVQTARPLSTALGPKARNLDPVSKTHRAAPPARNPNPPSGTHRTAPPPRTPSRRDDGGIW